MQRRTFILSAAALGAAFVSGAAVADAAQSKALVDQGKKAGVLGEKPDGFIGFVKGDADAALRAAVNEINAGRAQLYRETAARNGVSVEAAGAATYKQVVEGLLKPGDYYQTPAGAWVRK